MTSSPPERAHLALPPRTRRWRLLLGGACASVFVVAAMVPPLSVEQGPVLCPLKLCAGLDCPFCGMTRAFVFAAHGEPAIASGFNAGWPLAAVLVLAAVLLCWWDAATGSDRAGRTWRWLVGRGWLIAVGLVLMTVGRWAWPIH